MALTSSTRLARVTGVDDLFTTLERRSVDKRRLNQAAIGQERITAIEVAEKARQIPIFVDDFVRAGKRMLEARV